MAEMPTFDVAEIFPHPITERQLRAAGWVPLSEVLEALRVEAERRTGVVPGWGDGMNYAAFFLADRFKENTDGA